MAEANLAAIGFHAQQAVEKAIKAVCILRGIEVRRTHDLAALAQLVLDSGDTLPLPVDAFRSLNPFAAACRYDDELHSAMTREDLNSIVTTVITWANQRTSN